MGRRAAGTGIAQFRRDLAWAPLGPDVRSPPRAPERTIHRCTFVLVLALSAVGVASCAGNGASTSDAVDAGSGRDVTWDGAPHPDDVSVSDTDTDADPDADASDAGSADTAPTDADGGDTAPVDPCVPNPCDDAHRTTCVADGDDARCLCDPGYVDEDGDCVAASGVDACPDCPLDCGVGARCEHTAGGAACFCERGYQDHDGDGTCAPSCATADLDCGDRACSDRAGTAQCVDADKPPIYVAFHWHMHHPLMALLDEADARIHLRIHDRMLERTFGASTSRGIFPPSAPSASG